MTTDTLLASLDLWRRDAAALDALTLAASRERAPRFALVAPAVVDLAKALHLPLLALVATRTDVAVPLQGRGVLVATRIEGNATLAATWTEWKDPGEGDPLVEPGPDEPVGFVVAPYENDLRARLPDLPWRPGHLLLRAIVGARVTDPVRVELSQGAAAEDPDVRTYLDWAGAQQPAARPAYESSPTLDFHRDEWTPEVPAGPAIALALQPASLARLEDSLPLRGSYALPLRPADLVPKGSPGRPDAEGRPVVARLTITLVLVGHDDPGPTVIPLRIESTALARSAPGEHPVATGQFRVDLFADPRMPRGIQRYSLYAFSGEHMAGPLPLTLVSENLVPIRE